MCRACTDLHQICGALSWKENWAHAAIPNPEAISIWEPLANKNLASPKGVSVEKQIIPKGRLHAQQWMNRKNELNSISGGSLLHDVQPGLLFFPFGKYIF